MSDHQQNHESTSTAPLTGMEKFRSVMPQWNTAKRTVAPIALVVLFIVLVIRLGVGFSGEDGFLPKIFPGMKWTQVMKTSGHETYTIGLWKWPKKEFFENTIFAFTFGVDAALDMLAAAAVGMLIALSQGLTSLKETPRKMYIRRGVVAALLGMILAYTYHWCRIDPFEVWHSCGNAWTHLAGRTFDEEEVKEIREDAERAPSYYAEGEANYIIGEKYKDVPPEQTPSVFEKQKEMRNVKNKIISEMTPEKRSEIIETEYARLLDKKRGGYWPPELAPSRLWVYFTALMETIAIAIWASLLAVITAAPLSVLAASNTLALIAPGDGPGHRALRWFSVFVVRRFMDSCRGFNELVMALIFVSVIGLGPFAGILALWVHTMGVLGKVFSEAIEAVDPGQVEALVGTGAGSAQTISFSVVPQVMPTVISYSLLRFESNVRSAAILGWVGAGGIGFLLQDKMVGYSHREVCTMMFMIIAAVSLIDFFCGKLRRRFI